MKTKLVTLAFASVFTLALVAQQQRGSPGRATGAVETDDRIIAKLSEIVEIRERLLKSQEQMLATGRASAEALAEVELAEARVDLAQARGDQAAVITELLRLVTVHERRAKRLAGVAGDRISSESLDRAQIALLNAQVRLFRAQNANRQ